MTSTSPPLPPAGASASGCARTRERRRLRDERKGATHASTASARIANYASGTGAAALPPVARTIPPKRMITRKTRMRMRRNSGVASAATTLASTRWISHHGWPSRSPLPEGTPCRFRTLRPPSALATRPASLRAGFLRRVEPQPSGIHIRLLPLNKVHRWLLRGASSPNTSHRSLLVTSLGWVASHLLIRPK